MRNRNGFDRSDGGKTEYHISCVYCAKIVIHETYVFVKYMKMNKYMQYMQDSILRMTFARFGEMKDKHDSVNRNNVNRVIVATI